MTLGVALVLVFPLSSQVDAATQKTTWDAYGDCVSEYDGTVVIREGITSECWIGVIVKPSKPVRKIALQFYEDSRWKIESESRTNAKGRALLEFVWYQSDGCFFDTTFSYRIAVARQGTNPATQSKSFDVSFVPDYNSDNWINNCS